MSLDLSFFIINVLLGVGLAMDAFSVSLVNGLNEPTMKTGRMNLIAGTYGFFQFIMPLIGWFLVHRLLSLFESLQRFIPWIAFLLLLYIGGEMLVDGIKGEGVNENCKNCTTHDCENCSHKDSSKLKFSKLMVQGVATSIDALSVGFTIAEYNGAFALIACLIIALVTHVICLFGLGIGKKFGTKLASKAGILGGVILIGIGIKILVSGLVG